MSTEMPDVRQQTRSMLMSLTEQVEPFLEWLAGQRAYFLGQGYTDAEARAMAAAEFVFVFGANITRDSSE